MSNKKGALLTEEQRLEKALTKKKRRKIALKIFIGFLVILALFVGITTMISVIGIQSNINKAHNYGSAGCAQLEYSVEDNGYVNIKSDKGLKVMQLTDVHIGGGWMSIKKDAMAINTVATMIRVEKPDFVVVTGDISYPVPFQAGTFNNKSGAKIFAELMETLGVYWTLAYGNHDTEAYSYYTREQLTDFYRSEQYKHCLLQPGPEDVDGVGNQVINIVNSDGVITRSLITLDSHSYIDGDVWVFVGCTIISTRIRSIGTRMWCWIWQNGTKTRPRLCRLPSRSPMQNWKKWCPLPSFSISPWRSTAWPGPSMWRMIIKIRRM